MATNFYHSEQHIHFGDEPAVYEGYYVSTSSSSGSACCFAKGKRAEFEEKVKEIFKDLPAFLDNHFRLTAAATAAFGADSEEDRDWGRDLFREEMTVHYVGRSPEQVEELYEAVEVAFQECISDD